jgi:GNAT superfamily N-acetyltransferase
MKLFELFEDITYRTTLVGPETDMEAFEDCVEQRLYVRGSYFLKWYLRPEQWFSQGGIIVRAYQGEDLIGIGILNRKCSYLETVAEPIDRKTQAFAGVIGFFVKPEHRGQGVAVRLAQEIEREFLKTYRLHWLEPVVIATGDAHPVARRGFHKLRAVGYRASYKA